MANEKISIVVDPDKKFAQLIERAAKATSDLTIPFTLMTKDWFRGNNAIFALKGPGKYDDLSPAYKVAKARRPPQGAGFVYPILKRSGLLQKSLTQPGSPDSIAQIINKTSLILGTKDRTAVWHQGGTKKMPKRPMVFLGAEQTAPESLNRRRTAWIKILEDHIAQWAARGSDK